MKREYIGEVIQVEDPFGGSLAIKISDYEGENVTFHCPLKVVSGTKVKITFESYE